MYLWLIMAINWRIKMKAYVLGNRFVVIFKEEPLDVKEALKGLGYEDDDIENMDTEPSSFTKHGNTDVIEIEIANPSIRFN